MYCKRIKVDLDICYNLLYDRLWTMDHYLPVNLGSSFTTWWYILVNYYFHMNQPLSATHVKVTVKIITQKFCPHIFSLFRTFVLVCAKISIYFNIRIYFFVYYIFTFQNTSHQIIYFTLYFIKISNFLYFFNCFFFFTYNHQQSTINIHYLPSSLEYIKKKWKINSVNINNWHRSCNVILYGLR